MRARDSKLTCRQVQFGAFRFDLDSLELFRLETPVSLAPKPSRILATLLSRPGVLVSREALCRAGWPDSVVSTDLALNTAIRQIRIALEDSAEKPRYLQTVPRRGYRILTEVRAVDAVAPELEKDGDAPATRRIRPAIFAPLAAAAALLAVYAGTLGASPTVSIATPVVLDDSVDAITGRRLEESIRSTVARSVPRLRVLAAADPPGPSRDAAYVVRSFLRNVDGDRALLDVQVVRMSDSVILWAGRFNPHCPKVEDPTSQIADYIARVLANRI